MRRAEPNWLISTLRPGIALHVFEIAARAAAGTLLTPVGDLGDFENRIDFGGDPFQFAGAFQGRDPFAQIVVGQANLFLTANHMGTAVPARNARRRKRLYRVRNGNYIAFSPSQPS